MADRPPPPPLRWTAPAASRWTKRGTSSSPTPTTMSSARSWMTISPIPRKVPVGDITAYAGKHSGGSPTRSGGTPTSPGGGSGDGGRGPRRKTALPPRDFREPPRATCTSPTPSTVRSARSTVQRASSAGSWATAPRAIAATVAPPTTQRWHSHFGVTLDGAGNIFIADTSITYSRGGRNGARQSLALPSATSRPLRGRRLWLQQQQWPGQCK